MKNFKKSGSKNKEAVVKELWDDFLKRKEERKSFETQWQLNLNFLFGNQFCDVSSNKIRDDWDKQFFWEEKSVYNHIAPIIETRLSKLAKVRPIMTVVPASGDEDDLNSAKVGKNILESVSNKIEMTKIVSDATKWSEACGTSFYKVVWNKMGGQLLGVTSDGEKIYEGEVEVVVCSPFEIYPDSNSCEDVLQCKSIIHAKSYDSDVVEKIWGVKVEGEDMDTITLSAVQQNGMFSNALSSFKGNSMIKHNQVMVLEKYEMPSKKYPCGRFTVVAGKKLVFDGDLPFKNGKDGEFALPFVRQVSVSRPSVFWGASVIERMIPVQRAYNAVKNRKHEFINRLSMGILTVEDGSVDIDNLEEDGLSPGKILVYRQGSNGPKMLSTDSVPTNFTEEEIRLQTEFENVSGVTDIFGTNLSAISTLSGVALEIMIEQENAKISASGESITFALKNISQQILRLYKQFATITRVGRIVGLNGESEFFYWDRTDITSDDVVCDTESEMGKTISQRRTMITDLINMGILADENGKISNFNRNKILQLLGFGVWENAIDKNELQIENAKNENIKFSKNMDCEVLEIHNHDLHIEAHTNFMLGGEFETLCNGNEKIKEKMLEHIREHKRFKRLEKESQQYFESEGK